MDLEKFDSIGASERISRSLEVVSRASDNVRTSLIPDLISKGISSEEAYFSMHRSYFDEDPLMSQFHHDYLLEAPELTVAYVRSIAERTAGDYSNMVGCLRQNDPKVGDITFPRASELPSLSKRFFEAIDAYEKFEDQEDFWNFLLAVDCFLRFTHLPYDGSGRVNEDFLVFLCEKFEINFSLSPSGFRGMLSGELVAQSDDLKDLLKQSAAHDTYLMMSLRILSNLENRDFTSLQNSSYYSPATTLYRDRGTLVHYKGTPEEIRLSVCERIGNLVGEPGITREIHLQGIEKELGLK